MTTPRKYRCFEYSPGGDKTQPTSKIAVSDAITDAELAINGPNYRTPVVMFIVSPRFPADIQQIHAKAFCDYMNAVLTAQLEAYSHNTIIGELKK
tara:strand:- start:191 stop:475 length:285 start_codon:yes stop_codon:yes gene_type:complete